MHDPQGSGNAETGQGDVTRAPSDNTTVTAVLERLRGNGFPVDLRPGKAPGSVHCARCSKESPIGDFRGVHEQWLEGASDPDDMVMVVAGHCPECNVGGVIVLGFGPMSSEADSDLVAALPPVTG